MDFSPMLQNPGGWAADPSVVSACSWGGGRIDVFLTTWESLQGWACSCGHAYGDTSVGMSGWESLGAQTLANFGLVTACSWGDNRIDLVTASRDRSTDSQVKLTHGWHDSAGWHDWETMPIWDPIGQLIPRQNPQDGPGRLTSVAPKPGSIHVFFDSFDPTDPSAPSDGDLVHVSYRETAPLGYKTGWNFSRLDLGPATGAWSISAASSGPDRYDVAALGNDGVVYVRGCVNDRWQDWQKLDLTGMGPLDGPIQLVKRHYGPTIKPLKPSTAFGYDLFVGTAGAPVIWRVREEDGKLVWHPFLSGYGGPFAVTSTAPERFDLFVEQAVALQHFWTDDGFAIQGPEVMLHREL